MPQQRKEFGLFFWTHLALIAVSYSSPFWLDWKIVLAGVVLLQAYYWLRGGCDITYWEFGRDTDKTFVGHYLAKISPWFDTAAAKLFIRTGIPAVIISISTILQLFFDYRPYFDL